MTAPKIPRPGGNSQNEQTNKEEIIGFLNDMIDALTWGRVGLLSLLASFLITLLIVFENRTFLFNKIFSDIPLEHITVPWELSETSKTELQELINSQPLLVGTLVKEVNLKKNRRILKYWHSSDINVRYSVATTIATLLPQAFFTADRADNVQMLAVLNNEFKCVPTTDTIYMKIIPDLHKSVPYLCRLAVPPYAGQFAGFITLFLARAPSQIETDALKIELTRISIEMYLRDIELHLQN